MLLLLSPLARVKQEILDVVSWEISICPDDNNETHPQKDFEWYGPLRLMLLGLL